MVLNPVHRDRFTAFSIDYFLMDVTDMHPCECSLHDADMFNAANSAADCR